VLIKQFCFFHLKHHKGAEDNQYQGAFVLPPKKGTECCCFFQLKHNKGAEDNQYQGAFVLPPKKGTECCCFFQLKHNKGAEDNQYQGAFVLPPKKGMYQEPIATLDFASLYPSIIQVREYVCMHACLHDLQCNVKC
jgi:hypothetical protein